MKHIAHICHIPVEPIFLKNDEEKNTYIVVLFMIRYDEDNGAVRTQPNRRVVRK